MDELLETDFAVAAKDRWLYRCLDRVLSHKQKLIVWLKQKWANLFHSDIEVLLYDLTSTYFEGEMVHNTMPLRSADSRGQVHSVAAVTNQKVGLREAAKLTVASPRQLQAVS